MRLLVRLLATLVGLGAAVAGVLLVVEVSRSWLRPGGAPLIVPWRAWLEHGSRLGWADREVLAGSLLTIASGLLLCTAASAARRRVLPLADLRPEVSVTTSGRSVARLVDRRLRAEEDVVDVAVRADRRRVRVRVVGADGMPDELRTRLLGLTRRLVADLPLREQPRISLDMRRGRTIR
ncbi:hypothetical protein FHR81_005611 [Actinoalloteichus hoggarensis]|uniref:Uncharacterized protein n=1 Tax=Actinoalloteichus hoggarensis TaxID=1470176 RepID=A0A221W834_9PSEU|nr:DUF6286 domain-containing protein [Actinoalloteichus hoggarensis]ASO21924.1 hypothetical protein AHOG_21540 [Actinoalloteichus hoggarensis]MBB5924526.1 hypothetical protein [Actinoalloteichus hoggarensis]